MWIVAGAAFVVASACAMAVDLWYAARVDRELRVRVSSQMAPTVEALRSAVERRVALLEGLWSFAEAEDSRIRLEAQFPVFASGLLTGTSGVRTVQFVESGRIVRTWPTQGNAAALGYDLSRDPRPAIREGYERSMAFTTPIVTGPIELVQGGSGLIVRKRLTQRPGFPDLAAIVLDIPTLMADAGISPERSDLLLEVRDRSGIWFGGDSAGSVQRPVEAPVEVVDGDWRLLAAPEGGWEAALARETQPVRLGLLAFVLAVTLAGVLVGQRQARLSRTIADRESQLDIALRAGRMGRWEIDVVAETMRFDAVGATIMGRDQAELSGPLEGLLPLLHPEDAAVVARVFIEVLSSGRNDYTLEHRISLPDGSARWVFVTGDVERDAAGVAQRVRGIITDASDRRAIESRARQLERVETIGTMAGGVAHDFNNLLMAIAGCAELAREALRSAPTDDPVRRAAEPDLDELLRITGRAHGLTRQLLAFSRGTSAEPRSIDLRQTVQELEPVLRRLLGRALRLRVEVAEGVPRVWIEPSQLTQVLLNLVVNARDAIAGSGSITIRLYVVDVAAEAAARLPEGRWVVLEVEDTGSGMPDEVRRRIFEPYFSTKPTGAGTGLGLAVVQGVVRGAGGHALVESELGRGTRFRILLPPHDQSSRVRALSDASAPVTRGRAEPGS